MASPCCRSTQLFLGQFNKAACNTGRSSVMKPSFCLQELADYLEAPWQGDPEYRVNAIADIQTATPSDLSFVARRQFQEYVHSGGAGIVVLNPDLTVPAHLNIIRVPDPYLAYARLTALFDDRPPVPVGIHPSAVIADDAQVASSASVGPHCIVSARAVIGAHTQLQAGVFVGEGTHIGQDGFIYANASIYHGVAIGDRVIIHSGAVIGSDGFGFAPTQNGWTKIHQLGSVLVGDDVEIGASTAIDRGALDDTEIGDGVIIDNQVHIAHNVKIGRNTAIAGCVGIAGSTTIGSDCTVGGYVAINGHITIADQVHLNGGTVVTKSILKPGRYASGTLTQEAQLWRRNAVRVSQLEEWVGRIKKLEQRDTK